MKKKSELLKGRDILFLVQWYDAHVNEGMCSLIHEEIVLHVRLLFTDRLQCENQRTDSSSSSWSRNGSFEEQDNRTSSRSGGSSSVWVASPALRREISTGVLLTVLPADC